MARADTWTTSLRLWRSVKYEEVYLKAYRNGSEAALTWTCTTESDHTRLWAIGLRLRCLQREGHSGVYLSRICSPTLECSSINLSAKGLNAVWRE